MDYQLYFRRDVSQPSARADFGELCDTITRTAGRWRLDILLHGTPPITIVCICSGMVYPHALPNTLPLYVLIITLYCTSSYHP